MSYSEFVLRMGRFGSHDIDDRWYYSIGFNALPPHVNLTMYSSGQFTP